MTDKERLERYKPLGLTEKEALELLAYDKAIDQDERNKVHLEFDLNDEQKKVERQMARTGTRQVKKPMVPNLPKKPRKANATKEGIIAEIAEFLEKNSQFQTENVEITKKEREILLKIGGEWYTITLTYKRNMNKN